MQSDFLTLIESHSLWLNDNSSGKQLELIDSTLQNLTLNDKDLDGMQIARCNFSNVHFINCDLGGSFFFDCNFKDCSFVNCTANKIQFNGSAAPGIDLSHSKIYRGEFINVNLFEANLNNCDFTASLFSDADLRYANWQNCILEDVTIKKSKLYNSKKYLITFGKNRLARFEQIDFSPNGDGNIIIPTSEIIMRLSKVD